MSALLRAGGLVPGLLGASLGSGLGHRHGCGHRLGCGLGCGLGLGLGQEVGHERGVRGQHACEVACGGGVGEHQGRADVSEQVGDPGGWLGWVERGAGRAALEDGQQCGRQVGRPGHGQCDEVLCPDAVRVQDAAEPFGAHVEFGVGQGGVAVHDGDRVRCRRDLFGEQLGRGCRGGRGCHGGRGCRGGLGGRWRCGARYDEAGGGHRRGAGLGRQREGGGGEAHSADRGVRGDRDEVGHQCGQAGAVGLGAVFDGGVGRRVDLHARLSVVPGQEAQGGAEAGGQGVRGDRVAREARRRAEGHDVDDRVEQGVHAQVSVQVLVAVALVGQCGGHLPPGVGDQVAPAGVRAHRQAQRDHVGRHGDRVREQGVAPGAAGHDETEHDVPLAGEAVRVQGGGGDERPCPGDAGPPAHVRQAGHVAEVDRADHGPRVARRCREVRRGRQVARPVRAVLGGAARGPVGQVVRHDLAQRGDDRLGRQALGERGAGLADAPAEQPVAEAVGDEVVVALVPREVLVGELDQGVREQPVVGEVDRALQVAAGPVERRRARVGLGGEVQGGQLPVPVAALDLHRAVRALDHPDVQHVRRVHDQAQRPLEHHRVDRAVDLQALPDPVGRDRAAGALLGEPDLALCRGEGDDGAIGPGHGGTFRVFAGERVGGLGRRPPPDPPGPVGGPRGPRGPWWTHLVRRFRGGGGRPRGRRHRAHGVRAELVHVERVRDDL
ncbi:Integrase/recombinase xerD [Actinosynnema pretiosum subsp. pretiosum]|nr:Integrase/recombinase xerD [Actinosynnema pretiosum subsp. pretiosum]